MIILLTTALALAAAPSEACPSCETSATLTTLDNGLTVVIEPQRRTDTVAVLIRYDVGARDERDGEHGCAHLFEHLMFEGSANAPGNAFDRWLTDAGGSNNAWTSEDDTAYHMRVPSGGLDLALFLESDRLGFLDAAIDDTNLTNQQEVVLQERRQGYAEPNGRDWDALTRIQFGPGHPYHVPVIGTVADVEGFQTSAVLDFWKRHYRPANAVLFVVGNVDPDEALAKVEHWFGDIADPGPAEARRTVPDWSFSAANGMLEDDVEERSLYLSWPLPPRGHADEPALEVASWVLDGGRGTRMADALYYDRVLASDYGAYAFHSDLGGQFLMAVSSATTPLAKLDKATMKVVDKLVKKGPTDAELDRAKRAIRSGLLDGLEDPLSRAEQLLDCIERTGTNPNCTAERWAAYEAVTAEDVQRVLTTWLDPAKRVSLSVVPRGDEGALEGASPVELP
jgi:zinc protease